MAQYNSQTLPPINGGTIWKKSPEPAIQLRMCKNGDGFFKMTRTLDRKKMSFESWLGDLSEALKLPCGAVRRLYTPTNGHLVRDFDALAGGETIVAAGQERFKKLRYTDIDTSPRRSKNYSVNLNLPPKSNLYHVSSRYSSQEIHNKIIRVHPNGNCFECPRRVVLPPDMATMEQVMLRVGSKLDSLVTGPVVRLCDMDGHLIRNPNDIVTRQFYVALKAREPMIAAIYPEHGLPNFSTAHRDYRQSLPPIPRSNKTSSQSSPDHSNASHNGSENSYMQRHRRERMKQERHPDKPYSQAVRHKRSPQKQNDLDNERDNGPFKNKNQNPYTRDARPVEDSHHTRTERPIDQLPAETVQDEEWNFHYDDRYDNEAYSSPNGDYYQDEQLPGKKDKKGKKDDQLPPIQDRTHRTNARTSNSPGNEQAQRDAAARRKAEDHARAERMQQEREAAERKKEQRKQEQEEKRREREREQEEKRREREREQEEKRREKERAQDERKKQRQQDRDKKKEERQDDRKQEREAKRNDKQKKSKTSKDDSPTPGSEREAAAATKIQAGYRGYRTRKNMKQRRKEEEEAYADRDTSLLGDDPIPLDGDDDWGSDNNHQNQAREEEEAATKIQAAFRGHRTRKEVKNRRGDREVNEEAVERNSLPRSSPQPDQTHQSDTEANHAAASKIQATFRGHQTRKQLAAESETKAEIEAEHAAASKIQATFRGHQTRKHLAAESNKAETEAKAEAEAEHAAASKIQATFRGHQTRRQLAAETKAETEPKAEAELKTEAEAEHVAASKIQATFRGHQTRKQLAAEAEAEDAAASKIQATFRGHQTRRELAAAKAAKQEDPAMEATEHSSNNTQSN